MTNATLNELRDELELRRRRVLDQIDDLVEDSLHGRASRWRREELVDAIEHLLEDSDTVLLREFRRAGSDGPGTQARPTKGGAP
jgi:hypothetical protein